MSVILSTVKCFVFAFNFFSLILGICIVCLNTFGLEYAIPNTDEHTYCIVGIILGSFVCMATLFGCYGVVCESLGVSVIYSFFMLMLLAAQLLQMQTYKHQKFFTNALDLLEDAWDEVGVDPETMHSVELNYHCCGLYNANDYRYRRMSTPVSCYRYQNATLESNLFTRGCVEALETTYHKTMERENVFNWSLLITQCAVFLYSCVLSILLFRRHRATYRTGNAEDDYEAQQPGPHFNHVNSRSHLLSN
ncbi:PREDICTED: protein late bloomer [Rhagoletis zephyria]|uniref:protein late bloomer n=2 Tax=Rhagoletis zephyria TaxID=28612 RepID=UPI0008118F2E|nr:PREDICTED: protein late bloomer [Rhagoletis zephyria]